MGWGSSFLEIRRYGRETIRTKSSRRYLGDDLGLEGHKLSNFICVRGQAVVFLVLLLGLYSSKFQERSAPVSFTFANLCMHAWRSSVWAALTAAEVSKTCLTLTGNFLMRVAVQQGLLTSCFGRSQFILLDISWQQSRSSVSRH